MDGVVFAQASSLTRIICVKPAWASFAHRICTELVDPKLLTAFVACRLIPVDKNPGVRLIGM